MRAAIKAAFNDPPVLLQWFGHGSTSAGARSACSISSIRPRSRPTPGCLSRSRIPAIPAISSTSPTDYQALGETLLLQAGRGSVADLSPSGRHIASDALLLDKAVVTAVFRDRIRPVGDAVNAAKLYYFANNHSFADVIDTSDPVR